MSSPKPNRRIRSASELLKEFQRNEVQTGKEISEQTSNYYLHIRDSGSALKDTDQTSPRTRRVVKMGNNRIKKINSLKRTAKLSVPIKVHIDGLDREEHEVDIESLKEFQEFLSTRSKLTDESQLNQNSQPPKSVPYTIEKFASITKSGSDSSDEMYDLIKSNSC